MKSRIIFYPIVAFVIMLLFPITLAAQNSSPNGQIQATQNFLSFYTPTLPKEKRNFRVAWQNIVTREKGHTDWLSENAAFAGLGSGKNGQYFTEIWVEQKRSFFFFIPLAPKRILDHRD